MRWTNKFLYDSQIKRETGMAKEMRGERVLRDHSQRRTGSRKRMLNCYNVKRNIKNVVFIDVDSERLDNVIIVDVPESRQHGIGSSSVSRKGKKFQFGGIISIDDDDDAGCSEKGTGCEADLESDYSSSKNWPAPDHVNKYLNLGDDECQVVQEKNYASRASKCKKASGKDPCRNRYGLFESSSADSDSSDCEVMEGSFGMLHKEWEKAYCTKKSTPHQGNVNDQASASPLNDDPHPVVDVEADKMSEQHPKTSFRCNSSKANHDTQTFKPFVPSYDKDFDTACLNCEMNFPPVESDEKLNQQRNSFLKESDFYFRGETFMEDPLSSASLRKSYKYKDGDSCSSVCNGGHDPPRSFFCSHQEVDNNQNHYKRTDEKERQQNFEGAHFNFQGINGKFHHKNTSFEDKKASFCKSTIETQDNSEQVVPSEKYEKCSQEPSSCCSSPGKSQHRRTVSIEKDKPVFGDTLVSNHRPSCETQAECGVAPFEYNAGAVSEGSFSCKIPLYGMPEFYDNSGQQDTEPDEGLSLCKTQCTGRQSNQGSRSLAEIKQQVIGSLLNNILDSGAEPAQIHGVILTPTSGDGMISEREKLKETEEYKQAMDEEWASRQQQLQIQSEEAQRLRKKKRAESKRLLDMERRQKRRLEEIRETQKKDEEDMNLKEKHRVEVRMELNKLEATCIDMASLLRALGIQVGGGFQPLSQEVHAAYKQALLRFHPDRASKTDIRQQVEAEEKFKLISRMKEKLLLTTSH